MYELDAIRSFCFIWIVAVWHLNAYLMPSLHYSGYVLDIFHNITNAALGMFTFLSGALLSKYKFYKINDAVFFYKKRLSRFFILLMVSTITYRILGWISTKQVFQVMLGVNLFLGPSVPTLWFFSMMVFYYVITPLLKLGYSKKHQPFLCVTIAIIVYSLLFVFVYCFDSDKRLIFYFPMYFLGLYVGSDKLVTFIHSKWQLFVTPLMILLFVGRMHPIIAEFSGGVLFALCGKLAFHQINNFWRFVSVSSMIAYLFHRQFFSFIMRVCEHQGKAFIPLYIAIGAFVVLVVISYYVQSKIDSFNKHI